MENPSIANGNTDNSNGYTNPVFETDQKLDHGARTTKHNSMVNNVVSNPDLDVDKGRTTQKENTSEESNQHGNRCGCCMCYPNGLQRFTKPICYLICICSLVFIQSMVVSGYSSGILTTIETRYELSGSELGLVISSYDIASLTAAIVVSYYGDQRNRPTWLGRGAILICLGCILYSSPYLIGHLSDSKYVIESNLNSTDIESNICNSTVPPTPDNCDEQVSDKWAFGIFMGAFAIIGFGSSPIYSLGATYLYDNVKSSRYPVYAGIMYSMGALGPACGFLLAGLFVQFFVHPWNPPENYKQDDTDWVGAWWIGFLVCALLALLVAIPLLMFPKKLPPQERERNEDDKPDFASFGAQLKEFPKYMYRMVTNLTWLGISLVMVVEQSIGTGFNRFIAKYIELAFSLPTHWANVITGLVLIPAAVLGIIAGGFIMNKLKLSIIGTVRFLMLMNFIPTLAMASLFTMGCSTINLVGITDIQDIGAGSMTIDSNGNMSTWCNNNCGCLREEYEPVCGSDDRTYYSPCYAGCTGFNKYGDDNSEKNFSSCSCVNGTSFAKDGKCDTGCNHIEAFLVVLFVVVFFTCLGQNPALLITLRCVDAGSRSLSLGMQNFFIQLLAFIPAPIYFGKVFDSQCILWSSTCGGKGACLEYNTEVLPYVLFGTCMAFKGLTFLFLILTYISCKCSGSKNNTYDVDQLDTKSTSQPSTRMDSTDTSITAMSYNTYM